jgi:hypothetical protein
MNPKKLYLGDGVYATFNDVSDQIVLTTENGLRATNTIIIERAVWRELCRFATLAPTRRRR